jgi:hypothetical protein
MPYLTIIKAIYDKPLANIVPNGEETEGIPSKSRNYTRVSLSLYSYPI